MMNLCSDQIINGHKLKCAKESEFSILRNEIKQLRKPPVLTDDITVTADIGGAVAGDVYKKGTTIESVLKKVLNPDVPVVQGQIYWGVFDDIPGSINDEFEAEQLQASMTRTGIIHYFTTVGKQFECFAFPVACGELVHIYQNDLTSFDLIDSFEKVIVTHGNSEYYLYYGVDKVKEDNDKYEFLWR